MSSVPAIEFDSVSLSYGDTLVLRDVSLRLEEGAIIALLGESGSGKTTLLNLAAGHLRPDAGSIALAGERVAGPGMRPLAPEHRRIGHVFQDYALFPHLSVAANVGFGVPRRRRSRVAEAQLARVDLAGLGERFPHELSGGQQQRVAIARALARDPRLLLLDEPFSNLDAGTREHVRSEVVETLRATGLTCVIVTHDQEEAMAVADHIVLMRAGRVLAEGDPVSVYTQPGSREAAGYLGRVNELPGELRGSTLETELGAFAAAEAACSSCPLSSGRDCCMLVRPELLDVEPDPAGDAEVVARDYRGHDVLYTIRLGSGQLVWAHRPAVNMAHVGDRVTIRPCFADVTHQADHTFAAVSSRFRGPITRQGAGEDGDRVPAR